MPNSHLILCRPLLLLPPIPPSISREGREPLPDHAGESPLLSRSGGEKGLRGSGAGTLGVPLGGTRPDFPPSRCRREGTWLLRANAEHGPYLPPGAEKEREAPRADPRALHAASLGSESPPRTPAQGLEGSDREPGLAVLTRERLSLSCQLPLNVPNPLQLEAPSLAAGALVVVWGL